MNLLKTGEKAPDFNTMDQSGKKVSLKSSAFSSGVVAASVVLGFWISGVTVGVWFSLDRAHLAIFQSDAGDSAACSILSRCIFRSAFRMTRPF